MTESIQGGKAGRPFVILNAAAGIDGKIAPVGGGKVSFGGAEDRALMETLRADADAVLIGGGTLRAEDPPLLIRDPGVRARRVDTKGTPHPKNVVVTSKLPENLDSLDFFRDVETEKIAFTTDQTPLEDRERASAFARIEVVGVDAEGRVNVAEVVSRLEELGVRRLLLEGGGELNFSMIQADLVDEIYLTLCPFVFGGREAPTPCDGAGFPMDRVRKLALKDHRVGSKGEIFLRYEVLPGTAEVVESSVFRNGFELTS